MSEKKIYKEYFDIDPKYYAAVTADLIKQGKVSWKNFYPHETFVKLLEKTHTVLSGKDPRSLWVEGAYGTGKSHAALTVKSLLEASDDEVRAYFEDYGLSNDLCQKLITDKNSGKLITVHRIGSGSIRSDQDLILAVQDSIMLALSENGLENHGEASLKEATLKWLEKDANRDYFNALIHEDEYAWAFGGEDVTTIIKKLDDNNEVQKTMRNILKVAEDNGITALRLDVQGMANWIKDIIAKNNISAILFVWDEFTEFFQNNPNSLTGFQTLAEISLSHPFYFMIVSHESRSLFVNADTAKKILDRFVPPVKIELPENMAFRLMAQAMKKTSDSVLANEWNEYAQELNDQLTSVRNTIESSAKRESTMGQKTVISDTELQSIVPIHPYAALLLKHLSVAFSSNQRSMFDFIISNDMTDAKGFKWFINTYGPLDNQNLLTIDMLWNFFNGKGQNGLNDDVRVILDSYNLLQSDKLTPDEQRVFKTVLLLQAISQRISGVELLRPNDMNVDLAFSGTDWSKGKGKSIAEKLCRDGLIFKKPVGGGKMEYTVANSTGDAATIEKKKQEIIAETKTQNLIINADLLTAIQLPASIKGRFEMEGVAIGNFAVAVSKASQSIKPNRFKTLVLFAMDDREAGQIKDLTIKAANVSEDNMVFIECLTTMGQDLIEQYIENMAYSRYYAQNDKARATNFEKQAIRCLNEWKQKISAGAFMLYTSDNRSGVRLAGIQALQDELKAVERKKYYYGLSQYSVIDNMFAKGPLAQGAECGINQALAGTFKSSNEKNSLANALTGAWGIDEYWKDPSKKSLAIVRIKNKVEELVQQGFSNAAGRVSILSIFEALEDAPYGFIPSNIAAFVMGFVLKEYAVSDYFWSNGSNSESMSVDKMKQMIANALNQKVTPNRNYKEEYIVEMSSEQKAFLSCTAKVFNIANAQCGSIESARDQIRSRMKQLTFPIWCVKSLLATENLSSSIEDISEVIDCYCGIANTANSTKSSESDLADVIGRKINADSNIVDDLTKLITNEKCKAGMLVYIRNYRTGLLETLALEVDDNGAYIDQVKQKFNADAANWVWNSETADEKIDDVILEYQIIVESNKLNPRALSLHDAVIEWNKRSSNIRISFEALRKYAGTLEGFLEQLLLMQRSGSLQEQNKSKFYDCLLAEGNNFIEFYKNQIQYFKQVASTFIEDLDEQDIDKLYFDIPNGQFTKSSTEYFNYIEGQVKVFLQNQAKRKLLTLWKDKTGTKNPADWSNTYQTPIYCMFSDEERNNVRVMFKPFGDKAATEEMVTRTIAYLEKADFYERLSDAEERNRCFKQRVIGDYSVILTDVDEIRDYLVSHVTEAPHAWFDNSTVRNKLKSLCEKQYLLKGKDTAMEVINNMDADEAKKYLCDLIADNPTVGMEIIKNRKG
ncbi:hypothetical protein ACTNBX_12030 [Lachnospiraceae bacterium HCP1S3_C11]